jgi:2-polyprenyl-3-methyl-5-hydroxy-6-metoxy-1,4-benzoquinol methylase
MSDPLTPNHHYTTAYFSRWYRSNLIHRLFINLVHRKEPLFSSLIKLLPAESSLLDVGCGSGNFLKFTYRRYRCYGLDIHSEALNLARANAPECRYHLGEIDSLPRTWPQTFDCITCFDVLEHVFNPDALIKSVHHHLSLSGLFLMSAPNPDSLGLTIKQHRWIALKDPTHRHLYSPEHWTQILAENGFLALKISYDGLTDPPYIPYIPNTIQTLFIKYTTQAWSLLHLPLPAFLGESFFVLAVKMPAS